jgi:hypothetical protein
MRATNRTLLLTTMLLTILMSTAVLAMNGPRPGKGGYKPSEIICRLDSTTTIDVINALFGTTIRGHQTQTDCFLLFVSGGRNADSVAEIIAQTPGVVYCSPNYYLVTPEGFQGSSPFPDLEVTGDMNEQLAVDQLLLTQVHEVATGTGVKVAVIDGGVNLNHPYFGLYPGELVSAWDYVDDDPVAFDEPGGSSSGHGTFVAGIIRLVAPDANLYVYRVLDTAGVGDGFSIAEAVLKAISDGCKVINLSLGTSGAHDGLDDALRLARQNNIMVIAAAGNDSTDAPNEFPFPASREYCMAVAALDSVFLKADFSNYGTPIDVCAPGTWVYGPYLDELYAWWDGTSFSTPFVTGLAALLKQQKPVASWDDLYTSITNAAVNVDTLNPTYAGLLGAGQINLLESLGSSRDIMLGDLNSDGTVSIGDISTLITYLFINPSIPNPGIAADVNCDNVLSISDVSTLVAHLFIDGQPLCSGDLPK